MAALDDYEMNTMRQKFGMVFQFGALFTDRVAYVARKAAALTGGLQALGLTASGDPRHPLYLPRTARPIPFAPASLWP